MTIWMPRKKPLYAPMLATFGGGSANGFRGGGSSGGFVLNTNYEFTNYGKVGAAGPTQAQANSYWSNTPEILSSLTVNNGVQSMLFDSGQYTLAVSGAMGGGSDEAIAVGGAGTMVRNDQGYDINVRGGRGAKIQGTLTLSSPTVIYMVVGQEGDNGGYPISTGNGFSAGGGGASYLYIDSSTPLIIAGGGGGAGGTWNSTNYSSYDRVFHASSTTTNNPGAGQSSHSNPSTDHWSHSTGSSIDGFAGGSWDYENYETSSGYGAGYGRKLNRSNPHGGYIQYQANSDSTTGGGSNLTNQRSLDGNLGNVPRGYTIKYMSAPAGNTIVVGCFGGFGGGGCGWGNYGSGGGGGGYVGGTGLDRSQSVPNRAGGGGGSSYYNTSYISNQTLTNGASRTDTEAFTNHGRNGRIFITKVS